mmetsp:Transcript_38438/g.38841  ORF Transcript_38438/g.38841 Transcript_38438/m.38841 type:complete len:101 (-) Transcript_38438:369-671(-)
MARSSSKSIPKLRDVDGRGAKNIKLDHPYKINCGRYLNDNHKYSCVGCPVRVCEWSQKGSDCLYLENIKVDPTGFSLDYETVDLPDIMANECLGVDLKAH